MNNLIKEGVSPVKIEIITMYQAQLSRISLEEGDKILCGTMKQFQGLRKEVIIIYTVCYGSYVAHNVGFIQLNNLNNVAVTFI